MAGKYRYIYKYAQASVWANVAFAVGKFVIGIIVMSFFLCVNAMYNVGVALAKQTAVRTSRTLKTTDRTREQSRTTIYRCYLTMGAIILVASVAYLVGSARIFLGEDNTQYSLIVGLAIATFTFTELAFAIVGAIKTRKINKPIMEAIKLTNFASALISLALTQTAILSFTSNVDMSFYNGIGSLVFGSLAGLIGLYMIIHSYGVLSGKYYKFLIKLINGTLKKFDLIAVSYNKDANIMYVVFSNQVNRNIKKQIYKNIDEQINKVPTSASITEDNSTIQNMHNNTSINEENTDKNLKNDLDFNDVSTTDEKQTQYVHYSRKQIANASNHERFLMAKKIVNYRFRVDITFNKPQ